MPKSLPKRPPTRYSESSQTELLSESSTTRSEDAQSEISSSSSGDRRAGWRESGYWDSSPDSGNNSEELRVPHTHDSASRPAIEDSQAIVEAFSSSAISNRPHFDSFRSASTTAYDYRGLQSRASRPFRQSGAREGEYTTESNERYAVPDGGFYLPTETVLHHKPRMLPSSHNLGRPANRPSLHSFLSQPEETSFATQGLSQPPRRQPPTPPGRPPPTPPGRPLPTPPGRPLPTPPGRPPPTPPGSPLPGFSDNDVGSASLSHRRTHRRRGGTLRSITSYTAIRNLRPCLLRRRNLLLLSFSSVVLSLLCIVCLTVNLLNSSETIPWQEQTRAEGVYEACVPCLSLLSGSKPTHEEEPYIKSLNPRPDGNTYQCCARNNKQMGDLLHLMMKQQKHLIELEEKNLENPELVMKTLIPPHVQFTPVSAHKRLIPFNMEDMRSPVFDNTKYTQLTFQHEHTVAPEHLRNVLLNKNRLTIKYSGWYFLYSSVRFSPVPTFKCVKDGNKLKPWVQSVWRYNHELRTEKDILKATTQCCEDCSTQDTTAYSGGVFRLGRGDQLFVRLTGKGLAIDDKEGSFFGLVMLGSAGGRQGELTEKVIQKSMDKAS